MKRSIIISLLLCFLFALPESLLAEETVYHKMTILIQPDKHMIEVEDHVTLPESLYKNKKDTIFFILHKGMNPHSTTSGVEVREVNDDTPPHYSGSNSSVLQIRDSTIAHYSIHLTEDTRTFTVRYKGEIFVPLQVQKEERDRNFQETPGIISSDGVYLASPSAWYPWFGDTLVSFSMNIVLPTGWMAVSQGERTRYEPEGNTVRVGWGERKPQDDIYLVAGKFTEYFQQAGPVKIEVFLQKPDEKLAQKYLETGLQYLTLYNNLIGQYPYKKFALVENFWESGYGMPSFTLLGPQIIRFPFILHSSYPHEILHNWWGNGVFVDFGQGNWSEGLTAYLSDFLIKEQRGEGMGYRLTILQKYVDYVEKSKDFPLTEFRSRHSSVTEAIGYGKTTMFFHMLRRQLGDAVFTRGLQQFYEAYKFKKATFEDLRNTFSKVSGEALQTEFDQWVRRTGAPSLRISNAKTRPEAGDFYLTALLEQTHDGPPYTLQVPLAVYLKDHNKAYQTTVTMENERLELSLKVPSLPLRLDIDPEFDLFRRLDRNEIPPALSQAFGSAQELIILPSRAGRGLKRAYEELADTWRQSPSRHISITFDNEIEVIPDDRTVWIFGSENHFISEIIDSTANYNVAFQNSGVTIGEHEMMVKNHSLVLSARNPGNKDFALVWLSADNREALPGLGRKLPHYGKYSYLAFEGEEPSNILKGRWPTVDSPLSVLVQSPEGTYQGAIDGTLMPREPLASLEPVFSEERMMETIGFLADKDLKGRGFGTPELDRAAHFIAAQFRDAGLKPAGDSRESYFQEFTVSGGEPESEGRLKNIIGIIPGDKPEMEGESVVISAHYDHLGLGWPDVREGTGGKIHPGADDNASGMAVLLELAQLLGRNWKPDRTVVFAAFSGEEMGRVGSQHYVKNEKRFPADKAIGVLNMDTVGRLGSKKLLVLGTASAREWIHIFMGAGYVTGVPIESVAHDFGSSDQKSFHDVGIPAVQFFTGPHPDYHSPGDTIDKVDSEGLVKVASVVKEALEYLVAREEPLHSTLSSQRDDSAPSMKSTDSGRKVSLGTIPDFAFKKEGVRLEGTLPGSPAEKAGLQEGDIIVSINDTAIENLQSFSNLLKTLKQGEIISITFLRNGDEKRVKAQLTAR